MNINEKSAIIKELKDKYSKFNIDDIIETRIKQAVSIIKEDNKKALDDISKSFAEVKTNVVALKKHFDTSIEEISQLTIKSNKIISDNNEQTELWNGLTYKENDHKKNVIDSIQILQHESRNSQRCNNSRMNDNKQLLNTLPRISAPLNQNEGARIPNPQVFDIKNSHLKNESSTSFHNLEPSMGQNTCIVWPMWQKDVAEFFCISELYKAITDIKSHLSDKNTSMCDNLKTNNLSLSQINDTLKCFEKILRTIKTSNNDNFFGIKINEQSAIIKQLTNKYSKFNIDDMIEDRIKKAISTIKEDN
ncbi:hypothetical protein O181_102544 [Austropuccinia psidii MF-1]|uniref:Uncharacterized protein n=1 Tax=Austropuccinia psidii MF-1 TaxID=1389203 RepID=A0A9Q3JIQ4_9BASI|nr:hypothetical protein [Austropuccinia psidii MF-1]